MKILSICFYIFLIFAQKKDCGYTLEPPRQGGFNEYPPSVFLGGSNEYPQFMFWSKNKKNRYTPPYPSFANIKVGYRGGSRIYGSGVQTHQGGFVSYILPDFT